MIFRSRGHGFSRRDENGQAKVPPIGCLGTAHLHAKYGLPSLLSCKADRCLGARFGCLLLAVTRMLSCLKSIEKFADRSRDGIYGAFEGLLVSL